MSFNYLLHPNLRNILQKRQDLPEYQTKNLLVIADPGEGGFSLLNYDVANILENTEDNVVFIDVYGEFGKDNKNYNHVFLGDKNSTYINLFDCLGSFLPAKETQLGSLLFDMANAMELIPSPQEKSALANAINEALSSPGVMESKSIVEVIGGLLSTKEELALTLASKLDRLDFLDDKTSLDLSQRRTSIHLGYGALNSAVLVPVLAYLHYALYEKYCRTKKCSYVYIPRIDEFTHGCIEVIASFWKRGRMHAINCVGSVSKSPFHTKIDLCSNSGAILVANPFYHADEWLNFLAIDKVEANDILAYAIGNESGVLSTCA